MAKKPKMVLVVRTDLNMSVGKTVAQTGHAVAELMIGDKPECFRDWVNSGMKKVCLQVDSELGLFDLQNKASLRGVPFVMIQDAGLTELPPGTRTVIGIGPASEQQMKKITGSLKLL